MLLRRIIEHVRTQNWLAVGIDFLIVIFGVVIAFQITAWAEARQLRAAEYGYLQRLQTDIALSINGNEGRLAFMERQNAYSGVVLDGLRNCAVSPENQHAFANGLFFVGMAMPPILVRGVIDELESTGRFRVLRNVELRQAITQAQETVAIWERFAPAVAARVSPHIVHVERRIEFLLDAPRSPIETIGWSDIRFDLGELCTDDQFRRAFSAARLYTNDAAFGVSAALVRQRTLLELIEIELEAN